MPADLIPVPGDIRTERLCLRAWRRDDAAMLRPVLEANAAHLEGRIPARVAAPAPLHEIEDRLAGFDADFEAGRAWRFAIFPPDQREVMGEVSLFFRSAVARVEFASADRVEIGYWLREDATGRGYATEAARAMLSLAMKLEGMRHVEIRCDPANEPSAAVAQRLGFRLARTGAEQDVDSGIMVWIRELERTI